MVNETNLYYDARSEKRKEKTKICCSYIPCTVSGGPETSDDSGLDSGKLLVLYYFKYKWLEADITMLYHHVISPRYITMLYHDVISMLRNPAVPIRPTN